MNPELVLGLAEYEAEQQARAAIRRRAEDLDLTVEELLAQIGLRRRAKALGLAYWPALYVRGCDPLAYIIAEAEMARRVGARWGEIDPDTGDRSRGGWDSAGRYGLSAHDVGRMWFAAGCRDSGKFRIQAFHGIIARKGDSLPWLRNYVRGYNWLCRNRLLWLPMSRNATAAVGRLSAELRRPAIQALVPAGNGQPVIRIRHLDWQAVRAAEAALRTGAPRAIAALSGARRAAQILGVEDADNPREIARALCPAYPELSLALARRIALGESPAALAGGALSRREAHAWATDGAPEVSRGVAESAGVPAHRSLRVVRWLAHCRNSGRWSAVERERIAHVPGEVRPRAYSLLSVLDEIQDEDILTGRDSVDAVLQRTAQRLGEAWMSAQMADHRELVSVPSWARRLPRGMRILRTPAQLATEGREMEHCVGGYRDAVARGQSHILAIRTRHGRSTVELAHDMDVVQHRGTGNRDAPARNEQLLRAFLARVTKGVRHAA